jgi:hypothetical protein
MKNIIKIKLIFIKNKEIIPEPLVHGSVSVVWWLIGEHPSAPKLVRLLKNNYLHIVGSAVELLRESARHTETGYRKKRK